MSGRVIVLERVPGLTPYDEGLKRQHARVDAYKRGSGPGTLILLEHQPVVTLGRNADPQGLLASPSELARHGIALHRVERGGQATYHGPGQVVGYPILSLRVLGLGIRTLVDRLEETMIRVAGEYGVAAWREEGRPGIFCAEGKLGAIGIAVTRGISYHGFALNVRPDLDHYRWIVPCGLADVRPTSLSAALGHRPEMEDVFTAVERNFSGVFGVRLQRP